MRRPNIGRSKSSPFRIEPERGKFSEYGCSCWKSEHWRDVFEKQPLDVLQLANESDDLEKEPASIAVDPGLASGDAEVLAGETANDSSHLSTIDSCWESSHVGIDRRFVQFAVPHARRQYRGCRSFPFAVTDAASSR
jgi:hypothetical protein